MAADSFPTIPDVRWRYMADHFLESARAQTPFADGAPQDELQALYLQIALAHGITDIRQATGVSHDATAHITGDDLLQVMRTTADEAERRGQPFSFSQLLNLYLPQDMPDEGTGDKTGTDFQPPITTHFY
jgi:hypothetical protein